jgi:hypothetical protein
MSTTPRTDSEALVGVQSGGGVRYFNATADDYQPCIVSIDFARTLETELAQAREEIEKLRKLLSSALPYVPRSAVTSEWKTKPVNECRLADSIRAAIDAAASKVREGM